MEPEKRRIIKTAQKIRDQLQQLQEHHYREVRRLLYLACERQRQLVRAKHFLEQCECHGWTGAGARIMAKLEDVLRSVPHETEQALRMVCSARKPVCSLRSLAAELVQLDREFGWVECSLQQKSVSVYTDAIELEGIYLGDFEIRLEIDKLAQMRDSNAFRIIAQDPHPAATNDAVTHPHVSDECLCPGDAGVALQQALAAGRICDAFLLIKSVLETYNSMSPYVSLNSWYGVSCYECGYIINEHDSFYCEACDRDFCNECIGCCSVCDTSLCQSCLSTCPACDESVCKSCLSACTECEETMCLSCLEDGICSTCKEEMETNNEEETIEPEEQHVA